jgi:hypothetical protein
MNIEHQPESQRYVLIDDEAVVGEVDYVKAGTTLSLVRA